MQLDSKIHIDKMVANDAENGKTAWHRPSVSRIDIKRTMGGAGSASDGSGFTPT